MKKVLALCLFGLALTFTALSGCKIEIKVPVGGNVTTESGDYDCQSGEVCTIDVYDVFFDQTFTANPHEGYEFTGWRERHKGFCGGREGPCRLSTTGFADNDVLMEILESDDVFYLEPVFEKKCKPGESIGSKTSNKGGWIEIQTPKVCRPVVTHSEVLRVSGSTFVSNQLPDFCAGLNCTPSSAPPWAGGNPDCKVCSSGTSVAWTNSVKDSSGRAGTRLGWGSCPVGFLGCEVVTYWGSTICLEKGDNAITISAEGRGKSATHSFIATLEKEGEILTPTKPRNFEVKAHSEQLNMFWSANPSKQNVLSYEILMAETKWTRWDKSLPGARKITGVRCCKRAVVELRNGVTYWIALAAKNCAGRSPLTPVISATPRQAPTSIEISPTSDVLALDASRTYVARVLDSTGNPLSGVDVSWSVSDQQILSVDPGISETDDAGKGRAQVTALALGEGVVTGRVTGTNVEGKVPVTVAKPLSQIKGIAAGYNHNCAVSDEGFVKCWGWGGGEVNDGIGDDMLLAAEVVGLGKVRAVTGGRSTSCAITDVGGVKCWFSYGRGSITDVGGLESGVTAISAGYDHICAVTSEGGVKCWGNNDSGQLGNGSSKNSHYPVDVIGLPGEQIAVTAGDSYSCALNTEGAIHCWGSNWWGRLGTEGPNTARPVPVDGSNNKYVAVGAGLSMTCALKSGGRVDCWGYGVRRSGEPSYTVRDMGYQNIKRIGVGAEHSCAVDRVGKVYCWGKHGLGRWGYPPSSPLEAREKFVSAAPGEKHTCLLTTDGLVMCIGNNWAAQMGDGTRGNRRSHLVYVLTP